jgi:lysophospholipase L1-like esterase
MKRAIPWVIATVAFFAFGASFSELQRVRKRFGEVSRHQFHDHQDVRQFMIRAELEGLDSPIIVIGDSITEMARLPETADGHPVVNAGIGGATISDFEVIAPRLISEAHPSLIVVALGANDVGSSAIKQDYAALLSGFRKMTPKLLAVGVVGPSGSDSVNAQIKEVAEKAGVQFVAVSLPERSTLPGDIHLNASGSKVWVSAVTTAIDAALGYPAATKRE